MVTLKSCSNEIRSCQLCRLSQTRTQAVPGEGSPVSKIMFVGEAPGSNEDQQGVPFIGAAGRLLSSMLQSIELDRDSVFITNIVKCRPPNNRDPFPDEAQVCSNYLDKQIGIIKPLIIVPLGRHATSHWFPKEPISTLKAKAIPINQSILFPLIHPAAALHNGKLRETIQTDFLKLGELLTNMTASNQKIQTPPLSTETTLDTAASPAAEQMRLL